MWLLSEKEALWRERRAGRTCPCPAELGGDWLAAGGVALALLGPNRRTLIVRVTRAAAGPQVKGLAQGCIAN